MTGRAAWAALWAALLAAVVWATVGWWSPWNLVFAAPSVAALGRLLCADTAALARRRP